MTHVIITVRTAPRGTVSEVRFALFGQQAFQAFQAFRRAAG